MPRQRDDIKRIMARMDVESDGKEILARGTRSSVRDGTARIPQSLEDIQMMLENGFQRRKRRMKPINITSREERLRDLFG